MTGADSKPEAMRKEPARLVHGIDVSHYDEKVDWPLLKQNGVEFAIVKLSQGNYYKDAVAAGHLNGAAGAGMVTGIYHWCDPIHEDENQVEYLLDCAQGLPFRMVCLDVEQYWADWSTWPKKPKPARKKKGKKNTCGNLSAERISQNARCMAAGLKARLPAGMPVVIYTRTSFILEYARPMLAWLPKYPVWLAQYPLLRGTPSTLDWSDLNQVLTTSFHPTLPPGCPAWTFWQWSGDRFRLPGVSSHPDLNIFAGSLEELNRFAPPVPATGG